MNLIEIFKAGTRKDANGHNITISKSDLEAIAKHYDTTTHEAPLVIGHPKTDAPAYGWVKSLVVEGDVLKAETHQVDAQFSELVTDGKFKKISSAFYLPTSQSNPHPGDFYLRHVGFLGAQPPAVKGLKDPAFNDCKEDFVCFEEEQAEAEVNTAPSDAQVETDEDKDINHKQQENLVDKEIETLQQENAALKAQLKAAEVEKTHNENVQFAEALVTEGKLTPKLKDAAVALLDADIASAEFSEGTFKGDLKDFLSALPQSVEFNEVVTKEKATTTQDCDDVEYAENADPAMVETDKQIRAYMKQNNVGYTDAFNKLFANK